MKALPAIDYTKSKDTITLLHLTSQMLGKLALKRKPWRNHSWHSTLLPSARGFSTQIMNESDRRFQLELDMVHSRVALFSDHGDSNIDIASGTVADIYERMGKMLGDVGLTFDITPTPCEIPDAIPFSEDRRDFSFDKSVSKDLFQVFSAVGELLEEYRVEYIGKASPVQLFWGAFDLAISRYSGRTAPPHPGGMPGMPDWVAREAYSHEVAAVGFWPGNDFYPKAAFYAYMYPGKDGYGVGGLGVEGAYWNTDLGEWLLDLDKVAEKDDWQQRVMAFAQNAYARAVEYGGFDMQHVQRDFKGAHS